MKALTTTALIVGCLLAVTCARNPVTGERELALVSEGQEVEMGKQAAQQVQSSLGLVEDEELQNYVQRIGAALAADSERPELPWTFRVVDDATPNAFALPGGFIFMTRGMLNHMDSEAELAAVLGHEIAHVTARHSVQQISRAQLAQIGLGLGMILVPEVQQLGGLLNSGLQLLFLKYGRDAERQADELGFGYALKENYDVREMDDIFASLQQIAAKEERSPLPAWASTHPDPGERIESVQARLAQLERGVDGLQLGRAEFLSQLDGLTWGENPRNGYFEEGQFLHPELAFRMDFPRGWRSQNLPQAVVAGAPEQDAMLQLTMAAGSPEEAARQFLSQQGLQPGPAGRENINGLDAVLVRFAAQTQQGVLHGLAGFVPYKGRTYQIVGFAPAARYAEKERTFLQAIASFAPLTDPKALAAQPKKVDVVKLERAMSMSEFMRRHPSEADLDTLLLINQVPDARKMLPAGTLVKRIVG